MTCYSPAHNKQFSRVKLSPGVLDNQSREGLFHIAPSSWLFLYHFQCKEGLNTKRCQQTFPRFYVPAKINANFLPSGSAEGVCVS